MTERDAVALEGILARRHSSRAFLPQMVPREVVDRMFAMAQRTPSWCNVQPWSVYLLEGADARHFATELSAHAAQDDSLETYDFSTPREYAGVYGDRRRQSGYALYESRGIVRTDHDARRRQAWENYALFGAQHCAIVTTPDALGDYGAIDCGGYIATVLLAAESLGVGAVAQAAIAGRADFIRRYLGLTADRRVVVAVSFGYEDAIDPINRYRVPRESIDAVVTRSRDDRSMREDDGGR